MKKNNFQKWKLFLVAILTIALPTTRLLASQDPENLPPSWYQMPEDYQGRDYSLLDNTQLSSQQRQAIDRLIDVNAAAFEKMEADSMDRTWAKRASENRWHLAAGIFDLSVSASGLLGMLVAKGEATATLYWRKRLNQLRLVKPDLGEAAVETSFSPTDSIEEVQKKLEPVIKAVMASGDVQNEDSFRDNLTKTIVDYHLAMQHISADAGSQWYLSRFRIDLAVDISGKINPVTTVGGGIKLRFEWEPQSRNFVSRPINDPASAIGENLKKLVEKLTAQVETIPADAITQNEIRLTTLKFGLGITMEGNIGIIKAGGGVFGYLYFKKRVTPRGSVPPAILARANEPIELIDYTQNQGWQNWASNHQIPFKNYGNRDDGSGSTIFEIPAEGLRLGLEKAVRMGNQFAERAAQNGRTWELYQVKTDFALSITGGTALFKLGGKGSVELEFAKD